MTRRFSAETLEKFEAAAASIPMRPLDRAFALADIRLGTDPGGAAGTRRAQFRRYVASLDQKKAHDIHRLGIVLGALIDEVAPSKQDYLISAAASDGFTFGGGVFLPSTQAPAARSAALDDAREHVGAACRNALKALGKPAPHASAGLRALLEATIAALD